MAFIQGSIANKQKSTDKPTTGFTPGSIAKPKITPIRTPVPKATKGFIPGSIAGTSKVSSNDIQSSDGLYSLAEQKGLKDRADAILEAQSGEETKKIFSGGFISDIFDVVNSAQYGVTGLLKGQSFMEGVKTRQSFTDQDALGDKGLPGVIGGIALDIAVDPLTYIAPYTVLKKIPSAVKLIKATKGAVFGKRVTKAIDVAEGLEKSYEAVEGGTSGGKYLAQKFQWMAGADPIFKETFERGLKNTAVSTSLITEMSKDVAKIAPETASKILSRDKVGRFFRTGLDKLTGLSPEEFDSVSKLYTKLDNLGKEAVDLGLLSQKKYEENLGEYIKNAYLEYETAKGKNIFGVGKVGIKGIKARKEVENISEFGLTQVDNPAYLLFKSTFDLAKDVENAKMFKQVAEKFGTDVAQDGFTKLPDGVRLGSLAGKYVPNHMADYLNEIIKPMDDSIGRKLVGNFKFFKVIMNPATHARNIVSNKILNYWKLGMNPLDPRTISSEAESIREITKGTGKWIDEARPLGYNVDTFASAEMKGLLDSPEAMNALGKTEKTWQKVKTALGNLYQGEENQAKLSAYIFNRKYKNLAPEEAWKAAESATFNYAQVTPFVRKLRESLFGMPFITFTVKSTPLAAETLVKNPQRIGVIGKIKQAIESQSDIVETDKERQNEPSWVKDGFYVKLPIKDKEGRSAYFDLTYILPFGDLMSGNFFERGQNMETGTPEGLPTTAIKKVPALQLISELTKNKNFYGNKIWKDTDSTEKQMADIMKHLTRTIAPPLVADQISVGYNDKGERQFKGIRGALTPKEKANQQRTLMQELLRNVGAKVQPIDADIQETYTEWNKKKGLQNLLLEEGVLNNFSRTYIPKEK